MRARYGFRGWMIVAAVAIVAAGCKKDPAVNQKPATDNVNEWITEQLGERYYWNDVVKASASPSASLPYDEFLAEFIESLPWSAVQDTSDGETTPTIDGSWATGSDGRVARPLRRSAIYSYIERSATGTRADDSHNTTFGFDITVFTVRSSNYLNLLVRWVRPDSPADEAGLKRGMWITKIDGANITSSRAQSFFEKIHYLEGGTTMNFTVENEKEYDLTAVEMKTSPVLFADFVDSPDGKKVAYLVYNEFERGAKQGDSFEFDNELRDVFGEFKTAGATELVLDLRYNLGGYVASCQVLSSLVGNVSKNDVFIKMKRNASYTRNNPEVLNFLDEANSLGLDKVYVLTTRNSASASEALINSLHGAGVDVVLIGVDTNGKNVGMDLCETTVDEYRYEMWPITFKVLNADDFCDFSGGFAPDIYKDEFWDVKNESGSGEIHELGDTSERLLAAALDKIDGHTVQPDARPGTTRAVDATIQEIPTPDDPRCGGFKYDTQR